MALSLAFLGPHGTYSEQAALAYRQSLSSHGPTAIALRDFPSILQAIQAVVDGDADLAIVPVENSIEGSVTVTLDALWQWSNLRIQDALVLPIANTLITRAVTLADIKTLYSHPQPLGQCQHWIKDPLSPSYLGANPLHDGSLAACDGGDQCCRDRLSAGCPAL
jgi:prephenate dehydratase